MTYMAEIEPNTACYVPLPNKATQSIHLAKKSGDTAKLEQTFITEPEQTHVRFRDINEVILYRRNREMFAELEGYLIRDEQLFVVVGAAHLLGDQGIVTMLKQAGYEVVRR